MFSVSVVYPADYGRPDGKLAPLLDHVRIGEDEYGHHFGAYALLGQVSLCYLYFFFRSHSTCRRDY